MMNDKDLKRNGSGYVDEPCYKAVTAPPRPGEIWLHGKSGAQMLVLANINGVCPTLKLVDVSGEGSIPVTGKTMMYVKPYMIGYCFDTLLTEYVKSVKGEEMAAIKNGMVKSMGLAEEVKQENIAPAVFDDHHAELEERVRQLTSENEKLTNDYKMAIDIGDDLHAESIELSKEIDKLSIYKDMYMDLIGKLVSAKVGAVNE